MDRYSASERRRTSSQDKNADAVIKTNAIMPASATNASSNEEKIFVVKVEKPIGARRRLMGSSFMVDKTTRPTAANKPGFMTGMSMVLKRLRLSAPRVAAAS